MFVKLSQVDGTAVAVNSQQVVCIIDIGDGNSRIIVNAQWRENEQLYFDLTGPIDDITARLNAK